MFRRELLAGHCIGVFSGNRAVCVEPQQACNLQISFYWLLNLLRSSLRLSGVGICYVDCTPWEWHHVLVLLKLNLRIYV